MANKFLPILVKLQKESAKESDAKQDNCRAAILSWHTTAAQCGKKSHHKRQICRQNRQQNVILDMILYRTAGCCVSRQNGCLQ